MSERDDFEEDRPPEGIETLVTDDARLVVDIEGFEGPLDVLLVLARSHKVDITQISILELAEQYLIWVARVREQNLELAAEYLVMAAWLAFMKSRLLLPDLDGDEEAPTGEEMAAALQFQLRRLEAMQEAGQLLMARQRLGQDFFKRGAPETFAVHTHSVYDVTLYDLLKSYGFRRSQQRIETLHIEPTEMYTMDEALGRLRSLLGATPEWDDLAKYLPTELRGGLYARSALASTFAASLELVREGKMQIRQNQAFGPIYVRGSSAADNKDGEQ